MTLIDKIKQSIEGATGMPFLYHAAGEINELIARCKSLPVAYSFLIDSGTIDDVNGRYHERVTLAVMFCDKTEFDFNALENEEIIDRMKEKAYKWMSSLRMSNTLHVVSVNNTQRLYDNTTDILTGYAVNITLEDIAGVGECELPQVVIDVDKNGSYDVVGVDKVLVNVLPKMEELEVTQNGEYLPPTDIAGFRKVSVNVQPVLDELTITANGEYTPQEGVDGFSKVTARVVPTRIKVNAFSVNDNCIDENGYWGAEFLDVENVTDISNSLKSTLMTQADFSSWRMPNLTNAGGSFTSIKVEKIDLSNAGMEKLTDCRSMFNNRYIKEINVSNWKKPKTTHADTIFYSAENLKKIIGLDTWVGIKVNPNSMFLYCYKLVLNCKLPFDVSDGKNFSSVFRGCMENEWLDLTTWDMINATTTGSGYTAMFFDNNKLYSIIGENPNIEDVIANDIKVLKNLKVGLDLSRARAFERPSLRAIINGLADLTGQTAQTLNLGATLMAKLTEEDIAIATNKNWTIV